MPDGGLETSLSNRLLALAKVEPGTDFVNDDFAACSVGSDQTRMF
jgi:hypothetical protein